MFTQPKAGTSPFFKPAEYKDHLILITKSEIKYVDDKYRGPNTEAAIVTLIDLDGDQTPRDRVQITHPGIVNRIPDGVAPPGLLGRVSTVKTSKGHDAWVLTAASVDDIDQAKQWVEGRAGTVTPTEASTTSPSGGWGALG